MQRYIFEHGKGIKLSKWQLGQRGDVFPTYLDKVLSLSDIGILFTTGDQYLSSEKGNFITIN